MDKHTDDAHRIHSASYWRLLGMTVLMFAAMYALMYAMVDRFDNVVPNYNQLYMAALMTAPMVVIELALMRPMYPRRSFNAVILAASATVAIASWIGIREQVAIADEQLVKSMIPHHAGAILMCEQASLREPRVVQLCAEIVASQQREIAVMRDLLLPHPERSAAR